MTKPASSIATKHAGGRPRKPVTERTVVTAVRLTPARKAKLQRLGAAWLAQRIDDAVETPEAAAGAVSKTKKASAKA